MLQFVRAVAIASSCLLLSACVTLPETAAIGDESVRLLIGESETRLRALVAELSLPAGLATTGGAEVASARAAESLDAARISLLARAATQMSEPGIISPTDLAILGVTLSICRESLRKLDKRIATDRDSATSLAHGELNFVCLLPLGAVQGL